MLFILILNWLVRSGRLDNLILLFKNAGRPTLRPYKILTLVICLVIPSITANSNPAKLFNSHTIGSLPVPGINNQLFYLQRDPDANTVIYQLNTKNGRIDNNEPVSAFWIKYAEQGQVAQLTALQRKLAYGLQSRELEKGKFELRFVSYHKLPLYLVTSAKNNYVYAHIQQRQLILNRIFVRVKSGSLNLPKVVYIELNGKDAETGEVLNHRITI